MLLKTQFCGNEGNRNQGEFILIFSHRLSTTLPAICKENMHADIGDLKELYIMATHALLLIFDKIYITIYHDVLSRCNCLVTVNQRNAVTNCAGSLHKW